MPAFINQFTGLSVSNVVEVKAFKITCKDAYQEACNDSPIAYSTSSSGAIYQWMKRFSASRDEYLYYRRQARVRRAPELDLVRLEPCDNDEGRTLSRMLDAMGTPEKVSLLTFGGVGVIDMPTDHIRRRLRPDSRKAEDSAYAVHMDALLSNGVGQVTKQPDCALFTLIPDGSSLVNCAPFAHYNSWRYEWLTPLGIQLFLLVLQEWMSPYHVMFSREQLEVMQRILNDMNDTTRPFYKDLRPQIYHKLFKEPRDLQAEQGTYLYSGEHGMYWQSTSGYSPSIRGCTMYPLHESLAMTNHCCQRKRIFIEFAHDDQEKEGQ